MNILSATAAAPAWAAAASPGTASDTRARESTTLESAPDVVVTLGQPILPAATYDARGRMSGGPPAMPDDGPDDGSGPDDAPDVADPPDAANDPCAGETAQDSPAA